MPGEWLQMATQVWQLWMKGRKEDCAEGALSCSQTDESSKLKWPGAMSSMGQEWPGPALRPLHAPLWQGTSWWAVAVALWTCGRTGGAAPGECPPATLLPAGSLRRCCMADTQSHPTASCLPANLLLCPLTFPVVIHLALWQSWLINHFDKY